MLTKKYEETFDANGVCLAGWFCLVWFQVWRWHRPRGHLRFPEPAGCEVPAELFREKGNLLKTAEIMTAIVPSTTGILRCGLLRADGDPVTEPVSELVAR